MIKKELKQETIKLLKKILKKVYNYKSEINDFVNLGRRNAINDIENELKLEEKGNLK